jgi:hypothetical protein
MIVCFIFIRASNAEAKVMKNILATYEAALGQALNFQKFGIFCTRNVPGNIQTSISNHLGVNAVLNI